MSEWWVGQCWRPPDTPEQHSGPGTPHSSTSALMPQGASGASLSPVSPLSQPQPHIAPTTRGEGNRKEGEEGEKWDPWPPWEWPQVQTSLIP